jgi:ribosome biogenesis protein SSF1/2
MTGDYVSSLQALMKDLRRVMEPNTATKLKTRKSNRLKDLINVAGPLGVSHMLILHREKKGSNTSLRILRVPHGPTLHFRILSYTLAKDVLASQSHPKLSESGFRTSPLLVLHDFEASSATSDPNDHASSDTMKFKLLTSLFQNMFPSIQVDRMKMANARRVILFHHNSEKQTIDVRHYAIIFQQVGISRPIKRLIQIKTPDLSRYEDISEFVAKEGTVSDSEFEDNEENQVTLSKPSRKDRRHHQPGNAQTNITIPNSESINNNSSGSGQRRSVKLIELGPRLELKLIKIEKDLCQGEVLYHSYIRKTAEEIQQVQKSRQLKEWTKECRRREQEENVRRKEAERELHRKITTEGGRKGALRNSSESLESMKPIEPANSSLPNPKKRKSIRPLEKDLTSHISSELKGSNSPTTRRPTRPVGKVFRIRTNKPISVQ